MTILYQSAIQSTDNTTKAVTGLPNYLRNKFYTNRVHLLKFFHWLDERLSEAQNTIALIINAAEKQRKELEKSSEVSNRIHSPRGQ